MTSVWRVMHANSDRMYNYLKCFTMLWLVVKLRLVVMMLISVILPYRKYHWLCISLGWQSAWRKKWERGICWQHGFTSIYYFIIYNVGSWCHTEAFAGCVRATLKPHRALCLIKDIYGIGISQTSFWVVVVYEKTPQHWGTASLLQNMTEVVFFFLNLNWDEEL